MSQKKRELVDYLTKEYLRKIEMQGQLKKVQAE